MSDKPSAELAIEFKAIVDEAVKDISSSLANYGKKVNATYADLDEKQLLKLRWMMQSRVVNTLWATLYGVVPIWPMIDSHNGTTGKKE